MSREYRPLSLHGVNYLSARQDENDILPLYLKQYKTINQTAMFTLGGWSLLNIGSGLYYRSRSTLDALRYFWQGNIYWNVVNLGIASASLTSSLLEKENTITIQEMMKKQNNTEKILLLNIGLDAAYIITGFLLNEKALGSENTALLSGYGTALSLQGSFLLVFDTALFLFHRVHARKKLDPVINKLKI